MNASSKNSAGTLKGLRIQTLSLWLVAVTLVISVMIGFGIVQVMQGYSALTNQTKKYIFAQDQII